MSTDLFKVISERLCQKAVRVSLSGEIFWRESTQAYRNAMKHLNTMNPDEFWRKLTDTNPSLLGQAEPFFIFEARTSSSKKKPLYWVLIVQKKLTFFDAAEGKDKSNHLLIVSATKKDQSTVELKFENGEKQKLYTEGNFSSLFDSLARYLDNSDQRANSLRLLLECLVTWKHSVPVDFLKMHGSILHLFTQPDFYALRMIVSMRMESQAKRILGTALVRVFAYSHSLSYYIEYVTWLYFQKPPPAPELLRGDTILTTSLAGMREVYGQGYLLEVMAEMEKRVERANGSDEVSVAFLEALESVPVPNVLKWVCWVIFREAKKAFPEGNGAYNAVSAFFFLRGLFPLVARIENPVIKKKLMGMSSLTNLVSKPETEKFIPRLMKFIDSISVLELTDGDIEPNLSAVVIKGAIAAIFDTLVGQAKGLLEQLSTVVISGCHPLRWFAMEQLEMSKKDQGDFAPSPRFGNLEAPSARQGMRPVGQTSVFRHSTMQRPNFMDEQPPPPSSPQPPAPPAGQLPRSGTTKKAPNFGALGK